MSTIYVLLMKQSDMDTNKIVLLAERLRAQRLGKGVREVAKEIGVSHATLSRVENGKIPDLETFSKLCLWLGDDPSTYLGLQPAQGHIPRAQVHFKKEAAIKPETAQALSEMIMLAQKSLLAEDDI